MLDFLTETGGQISINNFLRFIRVPLTTDGDRKGAGGGNGCMP